MFCVTMPSIRGGAGDTHIIEICRGWLRSLRLLSSLRRGGLFSDLGIAEAVDVPHMW